MENFSPNVHPKMQGLNLMLQGEKIHLTTSNVYYEIGFAHGYGHEGSNILLIAKEGTKLHFDLSHLHVRPYKSLEDLRDVISGEMNRLVDEKEKEIVD